MSPESETRQRRVDAERNRGAIVVAAKKLFADRGTGVAIDDVAKRAGVGNATLYRHFASRADLIAAVYADEVAELDALSIRLLDGDDAGEALTEWLHAFVRHVATKRDLALAIPDEHDGDRERLFAAWHDTMHAAAERLLARAQASGVVRPGVTAADLLALASGIALTGRAEQSLDAMLELVRDGYRIRSPNSALT